MVENVFPSIYRDVEIEPANKPYTLPPPLIFDSVLPLILIGVPKSVSSNIPNTEVSINNRGLMKKGDTDSEWNTVCSIFPGRISFN